MRVMSLHSRVRLWARQACVCSGIGYYADLTDRQQARILIRTLQILRERGAQDARDYVFDYVERISRRSPETWAALVAPVAPPKARLEPLGTLPAVAPGAGATLA